MIIERKTSVSEGRGGLSQRSLKVNKGFYLECVPYRNRLDCASVKCSKAICSTVATVVPFGKMRKERPILPDNVNSHRCKWNGKVPSSQQRFICTGLFVHGYREQLLLLLSVIVVGFWVACSYGCVYDLEYVARQLNLRDHKIVHTRIFLFRFKFTFCTCGWITVIIPNRVSFRCSSANNYGSSWRSINYIWSWVYFFIEIGCLCPSPDWPHQVWYGSLLICDSLGQSGLNERGERECGSCERKRKRDNEIKKEITRSKKSMHKV